MSAVGGDSVGVQSLGSQPVGLEPGSPFGPGQLDQRLLDAGVGRGSPGLGSVGRSDGHSPRCQFR